MMKDFEGAMLEEKAYIKDRAKNIDTVLIERLSKYGYATLEEFFCDKKEFVVREWNPNIYRIDIDFLSNEMENAILNKNYGVYILETNETYAFHGADEINYQLCEELNVKIAELHYNGGTIIGDNRDFGIMFVMPTKLNITHTYILNRLFVFINSRVKGAEISGNDILIDGKKVVGSMSRTIDDTQVWAAQISFVEHDDLISRICNKKSVKQPSFIDNRLLTRDELELEVLSWLS